MKMIKPGDLILLCASFDDDEFWGDSEGHQILDDSTLDYHTENTTFKCGDVMLVCEINKLDYHVGWIKFSGIMNEKSIKVRISQNSLREYFYIIGDEET